MTKYTLCKIFEFTEYIVEEHDVINLSKFADFYRNKNIPISQLLYKLIFIKG
jgi:hypothetical protein